MAIVEFVDGGRTEDFDESASVPTVCNVFSLDADYESSRIHIICAGRLRGDTLNTLLLRQKAEQSLL